LKPVSSQSRIASAATEIHPDGMLEALITPDEIAQDRSPEDFVIWFEDFLEKTRGDRSLRDQILLRQGIAKPVYEEVFPLYRLLSQKRAAWHGRKFRNILGSQPYDVIVTHANGSQAFIEITTADVDQAEAMRMEVFAAQGRVPVAAPVTWSGTKRTGRRVEISEDMQLHSGLVEKKRAQIIAAVERKCQKTPAADSALLVYFDDYVCFADEADMPVMDELLNVVRAGWQTRFRALYVVGASGKRIWEEEL